MKSRKLVIEETLFKGLKLAGAIATMALLVYAHRSYADACTPPAGCQPAPGSCQLPPACNWQPPANCPPPPGCGGPGGPSGGNGLSDCSSTGPIYTIAPLASSDTISTRALGHTQAYGGHVFPSNHVYQNLPKDPSLPIDANGNQIKNVNVNAPANSVTVTYAFVRQYKDKNGNVLATEYATWFQACNQVQSKYDHLASVNQAILNAINGAQPDSCPPDQQINQSMTQPVYAHGCHYTISVPTSGVIGTAGGNLVPGRWDSTYDRSTWVYPVSLDFFGYDTRNPSPDPVTPGPLVFIDPSQVRQDPQGFDDFHVVCPFDLFPSSMFQPKVSTTFPDQGGVPFGYVPLPGEGGTQDLRTVQPVCGKFDFDLTNTAQGRWFNSASHPDSTGRVSEDESMALVPHVVHPDTKNVLSVGNKDNTLQNVGYVFPVNTNAADPYHNISFDQVVASKMYCYDNLTTQRDWASYNGIILLQMSADYQTVQIEGQQGVASCATGGGQFAGKQTTYQRIANKQ